MMLILFTSNTNSVCTRKMPMTVFNNSMQLFAFLVQTSLLFCFTRTSIKDRIVGFLLFLGKLAISAAVGMLFAICVSC